MCILPCQRQNVALAVDNEQSMHWLQFNNANGIQWDLNYLWRRTDMADAYVFVLRRCGCRAFTIPKRQYVVDAQRSLHIYIMHQYLDTNSRDVQLNSIWIWIRIWRRIVELMRPCRCGFAIEIPQFIRCSAASCSSPSIYLRERQIDAPPQ